MKQRRGYHQNRCHPVAVRFRALQLLARSAQPNK